MAGVGPAHQAEAFGAPQQAIDGGIAQRPGARCLNLQACGGAVQHIHHAAVTHHRNLLARVERRQPLGGTDDAAAQGHQRLTAVG